MFGGPQLIRSLRSFDPSAAVEMIALSEVFSIVTTACHHMPPTNCGVSERHEYICSSVVGRQHETVSVSQPHHLSLFSLSLHKAPSLMWSSYSHGILPLFMVVTCEITARLFYDKQQECSPVSQQLFWGHGVRNTMQYSSAVLIPPSTMSALHVLKYTKNKSASTTARTHPPTHTLTRSHIRLHGPPPPTPPPQRTRSPFCSFWSCPLVSVFIYSCSSLWRSLSVSPQTARVGTD